MRFMSITLIFFFTLGCACVRGMRMGMGMENAVQYIPFFFSSWLLLSCKRFFFKAFDRAINQCLIEYIVDHRPYEPMDCTKERLIDRTDQEKKEKNGRHGLLDVDL